MSWLAIVFLLFSSFFVFFENFFGDLFAYYSSSYFVSATLCLAIIADVAGALFDILFVFLAFRY